MFHIDSFNRADDRGIMHVVLELILVCLSYCFHVEKQSYLNTGCRKHKVLEETFGNYNPAQSVSFSKAGYES